MSDARAAAATAFPTERLQWIDGYYAQVRDYLFAREEDGVLILPPNRVIKMNPSGFAIFAHLSRGRRIADFPGLSDGNRARDVNVFFSNLKAMTDGGPFALDAAEAVERTAFGFDFTRFPVLGEIAVTYRCNNRCVFCYASCGGGTTRDLPSAALRKIIRVFRRDAKIPFFSFTGGEPLLRSDLERLIRYAGRLGLRTNLVTNGTAATRRRSETLRRAGLGSAQVSIESPSAATHDRLTGAPGSWSKTVDGIRNLAAAGVPVQTNTTLTAENLADAPAMPAFLRSLGITRFAMNLFIPSGRGLGNGGLFVPYSEIGPVVDLVGKKAAEAGLVFYWYSPLPHCRYNTIARGLGNKSCAAMDGLLSVSPEGDVLPCSSYPEPMGNLLRSSFREIWFSERARYFKEKRYAPPECAGCGHFTVCQAACPLYWSYAGTGEIRNPEGAVGRRKPASCFDGGESRRTHAWTI